MPFWKAFGSIFIHRHDVASLGSGLAHPSRRGHSPTSVGGYFSPATLYPFLALSQWVIVGHNSTSPRTAGRFSSPRFISAVSCPQLTPLARMARSQCRVIWPQWFGDETRWDSPVRNTDPPRMAQRCPAPAPCRDTPHGDCVQVTCLALGHTVGAGGVGNEIRSIAIYRGHFSTFGLRQKGNVSSCSGYV